jgi:PAS domain S-box-containing protein
MARKPTYKELEQKVKELKKEAGRRKRAEEALKTERQRLFAFFDGLPAYVYLQGPDHSIRFANRCFREYFGEPEGRACYQVITGRDKPCKSCRPFSVFETGRPIEWEWVRGDGRTYQIYDYPFSDIDGSPLVFELGIDVTERKHAEEALRRSENKYKTLLEHLPQKIFHKNKASVYLSCNENYARDLNIKPEEIKDKIDYEFFPKALAEKYRSDDKRIVASGNTEDIEEKYVQDGQEIWVHTVKTPIKDEKGNITGVLGIFWDITKRKQAEKHLIERQAALEGKTNELEEVNTALRVLLKQRDVDRTELEEKVLSNVNQLVVPYSEKLKKSRLDAKQKAYLSILESNLNDIISPFARMLSSKYVGLTPTEIEIAHLVKDGKTTKDIAELLNVSTSTIESHRKSIRMKIGIKNKKANLRSHLLSMRH